MGKISFTQFGIRAAGLMDRPKAPVASGQTILQSPPQRRPRLNHAEWPLEQAHQVPHSQSWSPAASVKPGRRMRRTGRPWSNSVSVVASW